MENSETTSRGAEQSIVDRRPLRISLDEFLFETSEQMRGAIAQVLARYISAKLREGRGVYLEGFGVVYPREEERVSTEVLTKRYVLARDRVRVSAFEKCDDSSLLPQTLGCDIEDSRDCARAMSAVLPSALRWDERDVRRYLRGFALWLREQVVQQGESALLSTVGTFIALGAEGAGSTAERFARSDIFISAPEVTVVRALSRKVCERPILIDGFEIFDARYGKAVALDSIDVRSALVDLGYSSEEIPTTISMIRLAAFDCSRQGRQSWIFISDGLRDLGISAYGLGNEIVIRIDQEEAINLDVAQKVASELVGLALALALGNSSRAIRLGTTVGIEAPVGAGQAGPWRHFVVSRFDDLPFQQLSEQGPFTYLSVTLLHEAEYAVAAKRGVGYLMAVLQRRGVTISNRLTRGALLA